MNKIEATMSTFSFLPLVKIVGKTELKVESSPTVDKIVVNEKHIKFVLKDQRNQQEVTLIDFNKYPGINQLNDQIPSLPLELMFMTTIDFLDGISTKHGLSTIILDEAIYPNPNFAEIFLFFGERLLLPFQIRRPSTRTIYSSVYNLVPVKSSLLNPIETLSDQYEDYLENALYSFLLNVSKPLREREYEEMIKNQELLKVLDRIEDLSQILTTQIENIRERYRSFSRIIVPLIQLANLKKKISDSVNIDVSKNSISYSLKYPIEISSEELARHVLNKLKIEL